MRFLDLCNTVSVQDNEVISDDLDISKISVKYMKSITYLISQLKPKVKIISKIELPFIEWYFKKVKNLPETIGEISTKEFGTYQIPDVIMNELSNGIYGNLFNKLSQNEKIIIKTLAMYILLSNK